MTSQRAVTRLCWCVALTALAVTGCPRREKSSAVSSASAAVQLPAPVASALPVPQAVSSVVNPEGMKAYSGPRGTVRGRVIATGDAAPDQPEVLAKIPEQCGKGREAYAKLFREGPGRSLADVLVAVTGYSGYVPELEPTVNATADGCFWGTRTFVLTFGQRIDIVSGDAQAYIPELLGEHGQPQIIATPGGKVAAHLYPSKPGRYQVVDNLKLFMTAEVLVLRYSTHAVTGLDGRFEIPGIPAGRVTVSAMLPQTQATLSREVTIVADKPSDEIVFELPFNAKEFAAGAAAPSAAASAPSAAPSLRSPQKSAPAAEPKQ